MLQQIKNMGEVIRSGETAVYMMGIGKMVELMDKVDLSMLTETSIPATGKMTSLMVTEPIRKLMELIMRVTG